MSGPNMSEQRNNDGTQKRMDELTENELRNERDRAWAERERERREAENKNR